MRILRRSSCNVTPSTCRTMPIPLHALPQIPRQTATKRRVWPDVGAFAFPTDPDANPRQRPALWSPVDAPDVVVLTTADIQAPVALPPNCVRIAEASTDSEHHLVIAQDAARLRLCFRAAPTDCNDCLLILRDSRSLTRLAAATRFERATHGIRLRLDGSAMPSGYQRARLATLLGIHDALHAGASSHDVAFTLVFPRHSPLAGSIWKGSGERRHALRLIAEARRLVGGGYRKLLRHD